MLVILVTLSFKTANFKVFSCKKEELKKKKSFG